MRVLIHFPFILILTLFKTSTFAQWERQTPLPFPPFSGEGVDFADANRGYIVGDAADGSTGNAGRVLETTDGGASWHELQLNTTGDDMNNVFFINSTHGWMVGNIGYKTTDGGNTWTQMNNLPGGSHYHVKFLDQNFGWTVSNGGLCMTHDGGESWDYLGYNNGNLNAGAFLNSNEGLAWTENELKKTTDGGSSWATVFFGSAAPVAYILDAQNAIMVCGTKIYYSNDGWESWTLAFTGSWMSWATMTGVIMDNTDVFLYNNQGDLIFTTDAGITWSTASVAGGSYSHYKVDANTALLFGIGGHVYKTINGGQTWSTQLIGSGLPVWGAAERISGEIWVVGNSGVIMRSLDYGDTWDYYSSGIAGTFNDVKFFDSNIGLSGGINGKTMLTTDGGLNWDPKIVGGDIQSIHILDDQHAFVCGANTVAKTSDQGLTWSFMTNPAGSNVTHSDLFFVTPDEGWLVSEYWYGAIWHTTDGGNSWTEVYYDQGHPFKGIHMFDANNGYAIGPGDGVFKTTDGWQTYEWLPFANWAPGTILDIAFVNTNTVWIVGEGGYIARSTDACQSWTEQTFNTAGFNNDVMDIELLSGSEAYAVTDMGDILHTTDAGVNWSVSTTSGPINDSWLGLAITPSGMWVSGTEVWYNPDNGGPMTILPVELISFEANCTSGFAELEWSVADEQNFERYEVERSTDGWTWELRGVVNGKHERGTTHYSYVDPSKSFSNKQLYRLKMVDRDGSYEYSKISSASCNSSQYRILAYPNPVKKGATIQLSNKRDFINDWKLYSVQGGLVKSGNVDEIKTFDIPTGVYYLESKGFDGKRCKIVIQ